MDKDKISNNFKNILKELRTEKGLSQEDFAKIIGISKGAVSYYEKGDRVPDIVTLSAFADYFGVSADYLLGRTDTKSVNEDVQIACKVTGLSENSIENVKNCCFKIGLNQVLCDRNFYFSAQFLQNVIKSESVFKLTAEILDFFREIFRDLSENEQKEIKFHIGNYISNVSDEWLFDFTSCYQESDFDKYCDTLFLQFAEYIDLREYYTASSFNDVIKDKRANAEIYYHFDESTDFLYRSLSESKELGKRAKALVLDGLKGILYRKEGD